MEQEGDMSKFQIGAVASTAYCYFPDLNQLCFRTFNPYMFFNTWAAYALCSDINAKYVLEHVGYSNVLIRGPPLAPMQLGGNV